MSFLYPRVVKITRPDAQTGTGAVSYGGQVQSAETPVAAGLPASIQLKKEGSAPSAGLPGDVSKAPFFNIFIPAGSAANGLIERRDIVTDDLGIRYQVQSPYWNSLGYQLFVQELEV